MTTAFAIIGALAVALLIGSAINKAIEFGHDLKERVEELEKRAEAAENDLRTAKGRLEKMSIIRPETLLQISEDAKKALKTSEKIQDGFEELSGKYFEMNQQFANLLRRDWARGGQGSDVGKV